MGFSTKDQNKQNSTLQGLDIGTRNLVEELDLATLLELADTYSQLKKQGGDVREQIKKLNVPGLTNEAKSQLSSLFDALERKDVKGFVENAQKLYQTGSALATGVGAIAANPVGAGVAFVGNIFKIIVDTARNGGSRSDAAFNILQDVLPFLDFSGPKIDYGKPITWGMPVSQQFYNDQNTYNKYFDPLKYKPDKTISSAAEQALQVPMYGGGPF